MCLSEGEKHLSEEKKVVSEFFQQEQGFCCSPHSLALSVHLCISRTLTHGAPAGTHVSKPDVM